MNMSEKNKKNFVGEKIRFFRKQKGLNQTELGKKIGLSKRMVSYYESETIRVPKMEILQKIASVLSISMDDLLDSKIQIKQKKENNRIWKKLKKVEKLHPEDQKTILKMIDRFEKR